MILSVLKPYNFWMYFCATILLLSSFIRADSQKTRCEAQQSSTNGTFVANNACDDDMETYSLTIDGTNQSWSMTLDRHQIFWIFLSISCGKYDIHIQLDEIEPKKCTQIDRMCSAISQNEIIHCNRADYGAVLGNKIIITRVDDGAVQIHEVKLIDFKTLKKIPVKNQSGGLNRNNAFDGNLHSHFITEKKINATWYMTMDNIYEIKWVLISLRGGNYEVHITTESLVVSNALTLCQGFKLSNPSRKYQVIAECDKEMKGNTVIIRRIDEGQMRLFELHPIICPTNHYGVNCAKCKKACFSCNQISGVCKQCSGSYFGYYCQHQCPTACLGMTCDQLTGSCDRCKEGYHGKYCELKISSNYNKTEVMTRSTNSDLSKPTTVEVHVAIGIHNLTSIFRKLCLTVKRFLYIHVFEVLGLAFFRFGTVDSFNII